MENVTLLPQLGAVLFFVSLWLGVTFLLSYITGWANLAAHYRAATPYKGRYERLPQSQLGRFGIFGSARNAVYVGIDPDGLHLRMFILFRINCRDLFIPWRDISVSRGKTFLWNYLQLRFAKEPAIGLRVFGKAGEVMRTLAGPAWPAEAATDVVRR